MEEKKRGLDGEGLLYPKLGWLPHLRSKLCGAVTPVFGVVMLAVNRKVQIHSREI